MSHEGSRRQTTETYDRSAPALAEYFKGIGPRTADINLVFDLLIITIRII